jgi:hypothetical protein
MADLSNGLIGRTSRQMSKLLFSKLTTTGPVDAYRPQSAAGNCALSRVRIFESTFVSS